jgi:hypothetical protein
LSSTPELVILKNLSVSSNWWTWTKDLGGGDKYLALDSTSGVQSATTVWNGTVPTSTVFSVGVDSGANGSGNIVIAYCFASISGFSKIGIYTGNGSSNSITGLGFQPAWVLIRSTASNSWFLYDSERTVSVGTNPGTANARPYLLANANGAENGAVSANIDLDSDGFSMNTTEGGLNTNTQTYIYMAFKENKTQYPLAGNMSFLVVAGGASGGGTLEWGGGGGAGGFRTSYGPSSGGGSSAESDITLAAGTYTVTIGAGGAAQTTNDIAGNNGSDSSIAKSGLTTITSIAGGKGAGRFTGTLNTDPAGIGGSGGGGIGNTNMSSNIGAAGTANQGYAGGSGGGNSNQALGGGGGGAGSVGQNGATDSGGDGGSSLNVSITGSAVAYAGGGGAGTFSSSHQGSGGGAGAGSGARGDGASPTAGGNATANTGSGGGGGGVSSTGAGGSGVVILRLLTSEYSSSTTGSPTVTTDGSDTILTYTGSGTYVHS